MSCANATAWIEKAKNDMDVVARSLIPNPNQNLEAAAYHCQQAAEKAIKALLVLLGIAVPRGAGKGHDLRAISAAIPSTHALRDSASALAPLTPWATAFRNPPDDPASAPTAPSAIEIQSYLELLFAFVNAVEAEIDLAAARRT